MAFGEARVTIFAMIRAALFVSLLAFAACADEPPPPSTEALEAAAEGTQAVEDLQDRVEELEADLAAALRTGDEAKDRARSVADRMERSLERLRGSLSEARSEAAGSADSAAAAIARADSIASQLQVLEERYEYHLRRYHGGG